MPTNTQLGVARRAKNDEFYTQLPEIENELRHYSDHFKGKTVYCNCDDPRVSNFFHYFSHNFERLGLKRLITSCYQSTDSNLFSRHFSKRSVWLDYRGNRNGERVPNPENVEVGEFEEDGDFRSKESIDLLRQADIVVTNPPFSLFREYVAQLVKYDKKFLIIGNLNAVTYKEIFPLIRSGKLWLGISKPKWFEAPPGYEDSTGKTPGKVENGKNLYPFGNVNWFTNIDHQKRHKDLILYKKYTSEEYPRYDNYDAINVNKVADIPEDYVGAMGVPISFIDKWNPDQFEIIGMDFQLIRGYDGPLGSRFYVRGNRKYARIVIRNRRLSP